MSAKEFIYVIKLIFEKTRTHIFFLATSYKTKNGKPVIIVTEVIKPNEYSWNHSGAHSLEPSFFIYQSISGHADVSNSSLIFVHTHPNMLHPSGFST